MPNPLSAGHSISRRHTGILYGVIASVLWGGVWVCVRYLVSLRGLDPIYTAAMRFGIGGCVAVLYMLATGRRRELANASSDLGWLFLLGLLGMFGMGLFVFYSGCYTASINSSLIMNSNAIFIGVFAAWAGERVRWLRYIGLFVGLLGCGVILLGQGGEGTVGSNDLLGGLLAIGAALCWASYTVLGKRLVKRVGGLAAATATLMCGALPLAALAILRGSLTPLSGAEIAVLLFLGIFPTTVAMLLWYSALNLVDASALGPTQYIAPVISTLLGWWLLHEPVGAAFLTGTALVMLALHLSTRE